MKLIQSLQSIGWTFPIAH